MQGESLDWIRRVCESMLHMATQAQHVCWRERVKGKLGRTQVVLKWSQLNWASREGEEGHNKRVRITMTGRSSSGRERAPPRLAIHHGK